MSSECRYTTLAQRYTSKYPIATYVGIQVNFWIIANLVLMVVVRLYSNLISETFHVPVIGEFSTIAWIGAMLGLLYAIIEEAKNLLLSSNKTVGELAFCVGF